jgi:CRP-like cAMP-binding protein
VKPSDLFNFQKFLSEMEGGKTGRRYSPKKPIFLQGDLCHALFFIDKGEVKLTVVSARGKEAVLAILGPGDFVGEECLTASGQRFCTATALSECSVVWIDKAAIGKALSIDPGFSEMFRGYLLDRCARTQDDLVSQLFNTSEKRLARLLLLMARYGKEHQPYLVVTRVSQETLAEMVGTTRSRVNYFMNKFRKLGFIMYNGELEVNPSLLSVVLSD